MAQELTKFPKPPKPPKITDFPKPPPSLLKPYLPSKKTETELADLSKKIVPKEEPKKESKEEKKGIIRTAAPILADFAASLASTVAGESIAMTIATRVLPKAIPGVGWLSTAIEAGKIAKKVLPGVKKLLPGIVRLFGGAAGYSGYEVGKKVLKKEIESEEIPEAFFKETAKNAVIFAGGTAGLYGLKYGYKGIQTVPGAKKVVNTIQEKFSKAIDKVFYNDVPKPLRQEISKRFSRIFSDTYVLAPAVYERIQTFVKHPEFQTKLIPAVAKGMIASSKTPERTARIINQFLETSSVYFSKGENPLEIVALEHFLVNREVYSKHFPELDKLFKELVESLPHYQELLNAKKEAFIANLRGILARSFEGIKEEAKTVLNQIKKETKFLAKKFKIPKEIAEEQLKLRNKKYQSLNVLAAEMGISLEALTKMDPYILAELFMKRMPYEKMAETYIPHDVIKIYGQRRTTTKSFLSSDVLQDIAPEEIVIEGIEPQDIDLFVSLRFFYQAPTLTEHLRKRSYRTLAARLASYFDQLAKKYELAMKFQELAGKIPVIPTHEEIIKQALEEIKYFSGGDTGKAFLTSLFTPRVIKTEFDLLKIFAKYPEYYQPKNPHHPAFVPVSLAGKGAYLHRGLFELLNQVASLAALREDKAWRIFGARTPLDKFNSWMKFWVLRFSPFHFIALTKNYFAAGIKPLEYFKALGNAFSQAFFKKDAFDFLNYEMEIHQAIKDLTAKGYDVTPVTTGIPKSYLDMITAFYTKILKDKLLEIGKEKSTAILKGARVLSDFLKDFYNFDQRFIWDGFYNSVKTIIAGEVAKNYNRGLITAEEAIRQFASINDIFGGSTIWHFIPLSKQKWIRLLLFAPDWYLSLWTNFTVWLKDKSMLVTDFFPALIRMHLVFADVLSRHYYGQGLYDRFQIDQWSLKQFLANWQELFKIRIPFLDKEGKRRVLTIDTVGVELEPLHMIGLYSFLTDIGKLVNQGEISLRDIENVLVGMPLEMLNFWKNKISMTLKLIQAFLTVTTHKGEAKEHIEEFFKRFPTITLPITFSQILMNKYAKYLYPPEEIDHSTLAGILRSITFKAYVSDDFADFVIKNLYNPSLPRLYEEMKKKYEEIKRIEVAEGLRKYKSLVTFRRNFDELMARAIVSRLFRNHIEAEIEKYRDEFLKDEYTLFDVHAKIYSEVLPKIQEQIEAKLENAYLPDSVRKEIDKALKKVIEERRKRVEFEFLTEKE